MAKKHKQAQKEVQEYIRKVQQADGIYIDPLTAYQERRLWKKDPSRRNIWLNNLNVTFLRSVKFKLQNGGNLAIGIWGEQMTGKSIAARSCAMVKTTLFKKYFDIQGKVYIAFETDEFLRYINITNKGDVVILDEIGKQTGEDALTVYNAVKNVTEQIRFAQVSLIFASPLYKPYFDACNFLLKCYGWIKRGEETRNLLLVYKSGEKKGLPLGHLQLKTLTTPKIEAEYEIKKKENIQRLKDQKGLSFVSIHEEEIQDYARLILYKLKEKYGPGYINMKKALMTSYAKRLQLGISPRLLNHILEEVWYKIKDQEFIFDQQKHTQKSPQNLGYDFEFEEDKGFIQYMQEFIRREGLKYEDKIEDFKAKICSIVYPYLIFTPSGRKKKSTPTIVLEIAWEQSARQLDRHIVALRQFLMQPEISKKTGELFEEYYAALKRSQGFKVKQGGKNTSEPDLLVYNEKTDLWEPYSLKCHHRERPSIFINILEIAESEIEQAKKTGILYVVLINPFWDPSPQVKKFTGDIEKVDGFKFRRP